MTTPNETATDLLTKVIYRERMNSWRHETGRITKREFNAYHKAITAEFLHKESVIAALLGVDISSASVFEANRRSHEKYLADIAPVPEFIPGRNASRAAA